MKCYLCNGDNLAKIHDKIRFDYDFKPYKCNNCGLVFLYPYFSSSELDEFYKNQYRSLFGNETPEELFRRCLPEAINRVERFKQILKNSKNVLEIGCSTGHFLYAVGKMCPKVYGIEPDKRAKKHAKNLGIAVKNKINEFEPNSFDAIFMFHVLEHIQDPIIFLKEIRTYLKEKGKIIVEVPNVDDILVSVYKIEKFKDMYFSAPHKFYFSRDTLKTILRQSGFKSTIYPLQRYDFSNHIFWLLYGKPGGMGYFKDIFSNKLDAEYAECLKRQYLCDTIYAIGEKDD